MSRTARRAYVGVGSNIAPSASVAAGLAALQRQFGEIEQSTIYVCADRDGGERVFHNLVVAFNTRLNWSELRAQLKSIEDQCGRRRGDKSHATVTLDLDILILCGHAGASDKADLPLEALLAHSYVLAPLAELAPDWLHPQAGLPLAQLWQQVAATAPALTPVNAGDTAASMELEVVP